MISPVPTRLPFVDPRTDPDPSAPRPPSRFTRNPEELAGLHRFCREGRLYDVERWIRSGRPLQLPAGFLIDRRHRFRTAVEIAFDRQDHALLLLLLANGYDQAAEPECPLDVALRARRKDLLDLLLEWGADPEQISVGLLCDTYDTELYERFRALGIDLTSGHELAYGLAYHTSNKPLFGFAKRHLPNEPKIQFELDIALAYHAWEGNQKGVMLCLWAGANPRTPVPNLRWGSVDEDEDEWSSAVYAACSSGHATVLERLEPDPALDDYEELWSCASTAKVVDILAKGKLPEDPSRIVVRQVAGSTWACRGHYPVETLEAVFKAGVRWESSPKEEIGQARRDLLRSDDWTFDRMMKLLATGDYCSEEVLTELARTPAIRKRMKRRGLIPDTEKDGKHSGFGLTAMPRRALLKFGIERRREKSSKRAKAEIGSPRTLRIGGRARDAQVVRLSRRELFERVWATPVETLARDWNLSGRGLAKACARLKIPVPPRGYWAKVNAGQKVRRRRPRLVKLPPGQAEEIVIRLRQSVDDG